MLGQFGPQRPLRDRFGELFEQTIFADDVFRPRRMSDLNILAVTAGKERSAAEWKKLLSGADFDCRGIMPGS
jgi:hypothetical protein